MANTNFKVDNGLLVNGDSLFQSNTVINANARVVENLTVDGNLGVNGDISFTNMLVSGQLLPTANGVLLGNANKRFTISGDTLNISNSIITSNGTNINITAGSGLVANTIGISVNASSISNGIVNIGQGGTNAATREIAINNLLPTQNTAVQNYFLRTNGSGVEWVVGAGTQGPLGYTGSQGPIGFTGSRGEVGFTGSQGTAGTNGSTGATGAQGTTGFTGSRGNVGFTGSQGVGFTGSQGTTGSSGATGFTGSQGSFTGSYTGNMAITGAITATGDITAFFSDDRLKTKFGNIESALDKLLALSGFIFEPNELAQSLGYEKKREVGVSAQEVKAVLPEAIASAPIDSKYMAVKYERLIPLVIEAIKELADIVKALENKSNAD
jgi:hypothetical protein